MIRVSLVDLRLGWASAKHLAQQRHRLVPRWLWWYPWEGSGIWACRRCVSLDYSAEVVNAGPDLAPDTGVDDPQLFRDQLAMETPEPSPTDELSAAGLRRLLDAIDAIDREDLYLLCDLVQWWWRFHDGISTLDDEVRQWLRTPRGRELAERLRMDPS